MGEVFEAEDTRLGRRVALKLLTARAASDGQRLERFQQEARAVAALNHPNIVTLFSVEEEGGVPFLTMELVEGDRLDTLIPRSGVSLERFYEVALPLADALSAAHDQGITHRDLKPANVMMTPEGRVKVLDFGLARLRPVASAEEASAASTASGDLEDSLEGTIPYMAPEQLEAKSQDQRADIFSLGVLLYELATGQRPFRGDSAPGLVSAILRDTPPPVSDSRPRWPGELSRLIRRCLEKDPERRLQTVKDLRNELEELRNESRPDRRTPTSIAVLPFADMSPERDHGYFCEGIAEEILNALARIENLRVAARTSSFQFKGRSHDVRDIGRRLNVGAVLEGSVRKSGDRVRITVQLIDVTDGYHLWSERFDSEIRDIFDIQDEISQSVVRALEVQLSPDERQALGERPVADVEAYDYYLRGRQYFDEVSEQAFEFAIEMFWKATELDPGFAQAHAGMATSQAWLFHWFGHDKEKLAKADRVSQRAVELAPELAEAHAARGFVLSLLGRREEAVEALETGIRLDPRLFDSYYFYGRVAMASGDYVKAAEMFESAAAASPEDYQAILLVPQVYRSLGRPRDEEEAYRRGLERVEQRLELNPDDARALYLGAGAHLSTGDRDRALEWTERAAALRPDEQSTLYNCACLYSRAGEPERALDCLEKAFASGYGFKDWIEHDSDLDPLRELPRFRKLLSRMS
jgi:serine/threonine protein kinase/Flp pilus assembly protein TadD